MKWYLKVLRQYADFNGRARRSEYWYFALFNFIIGMAFVFIDGLITSMSDGGFGMLNLIYSLAVLIPGIAVAVRRMHDVGKSGWYMLIPIYNIILAFTEGEKGENQYGPDPKNEDLVTGDIARHLVE